MNIILMFAASLVRQVVTSVVSIGVLLSGLAMEDPIVMLANLLG